MNQEDLKNLTGWLQAIFKEIQTTHGVAADVKRNTDLIPDIQRNAHDGAPIDGHKLEDQMRKLEDLLNHLKDEVHDLKDKIDRIR